MKLINLKTKLMIGFLSVITAGCLGCKKDIKSELPGGKEDIALNYYMASDVMATIYGPTKTQSYTAIYVDSITKGPVFTITNKIPFFLFGALGGNEYPAVRNLEFSYIHYNAGSHRFMFSDTSRSIVLDTTIHFRPQKYSCLYLVDLVTAVNAPPAYKLITTEEERAVPADKIGVRFIHLSADAGSLACFRRNADGSLINALPADLKFGEASAYQYFSAADTVGGVLRFALYNQANGATIITGVPYNPGRGYTVLVTGFLNDQQRQIPTGTNPDGSTKYIPITVYRNLRAQLRISY